MDLDGVAALGSARAGVGVGVLCCYGGGGGEGGGEEEEGGEEWEGEMHCG